MLHAIYVSNEIFRFLKNFLRRKTEEYHTFSMSLLQVYGI